MNIEKDRQEGKEGILSTQSLLLPPCLVHKFGSAYSARSCTLLHLGFSSFGYFSHGFINYIYLNHLVHIMSSFKGIDRIKEPLSLQGDTRINGVLLLEVLSFFSFFVFLTLVLTLSARMCLGGMFVPAIFDLAISPNLDKKLENIQTEGCMFKYRITSLNQSAICIATQAICRVQCSNKERVHTYGK